MAELRARPELDTDGDGAVSEEEAQVGPPPPPHPPPGPGGTQASRKVTPPPHTPPVSPPPQALLGDPAPVDAATFRDRLWATIKHHYRPQVGLGGVSRLLGGGGGLQGFGRGKPCCLPRLGRCYEKLVWGN